MGGGTWDATKTDRRVRGGPLQWGGRRHFARKEAEIKGRRYSRSGLEDWDGGLPARAKTSWTAVGRAKKWQRDGQDGQDERATSLRVLQRASCDMRRWLGRRDRFAGSPACHLMLVGTFDPGTSGTCIVLASVRICRRKNLIAPRPFPPSTEPLAVQSSTGDGSAMDQRSQDAPMSL